jgi:hypothetical protein
MNSFTVVDWSVQLGSVALGLVILPLGTKKQNTVKKKTPNYS